MFTKSVTVLVAMLTTRLPQTDPRDALCHTYRVVDAQCDKLTTIVGQTKLTTFAMVGVSWQNLSPESLTKFQREVPLFLEIPEFPYSTVCGLVV